MKLIQVNNAVEGGKKAFELVQNAMDNGLQTMGLATGSTPETLYQEMVASDLDFSALTSVNLDEYVGLSATDPQSYHMYMHEHLFAKKPFKESYIPNGKAEDLNQECQRYEEILTNHPVDLQILGIGRNGHIGFNEPNTPFDTPTHVVELTESTIKANQRYFDKIEDVPTRAISMGIQSIMQSKAIVLLAFGKSKAQAIKGMIEGPITEDLPASVLQKHPNVTIIADEDATCELNR
ncbi:glucosamine-6-phosphate deaminase [uncultured Enterococcus sp.]|uniref:glucosamine-6-phosphate deaminase n=1 Tax=uncultured Enterococcus sp. TaxID=167972 RepID=UPI0025ED3B3E|nr:glucosamine-6-phosphate deaminase [uncultured Enterococcus sp.]